MGMYKINRVEEIKQRKYDIEQIGLNSFAEKLNGGLNGIEVKQDFRGLNG